MDSWGYEFEVSRLREYKWLLCDERFNALRWHEQGFFFRLITWADDEGRFDAAPNILRASLYPLSLGKVSAREVEAMLRRVAECDLVKLCDYNGKVYGIVSRGRTAASNCAHPVDVSALGNSFGVDGVSAYVAATNSALSAVEERVT